MSAAFWTIIVASAIIFAVGFLGGYFVCLEKHEHLLEEHYTEEKK